jgi:sulfite exporter TauE/SafE
MGAIVAGIFGSFEVHKFSMQYRAGFAVASGLALIGLGLIVFRILPLPAFVTRLLSPQAPVLGRHLARLTNSGSPGSKLGLGLLVGLLPCGLTWAMLVAAASTLSTFRGFATMVSFGLGTVPALLAAGLSVSLVSARTRLFGERAAAVFIILMGALLTVRGLGAVLGFGDNCCPMDLLSGSGLLR